MRIACYAAEIVFRIYFNNVKHLVYAKVSYEIEPAFEGDNRHARHVAKERQSVLGQWLDKDYPLSYSGPLTYLLRAVVNTNDGNTTLQLKSFHLGNKPIFFVDNVIKQSTTNLTWHQPPFITGGNFLAIVHVAIKEMKWYAGRNSI
jgi:hypothetical protein